MKVFLCLLLIINSINFVLLIIPEWDLAGSGIELTLNQKYIVDERNLLGAYMRLQKEITKDDSGNLKVRNHVTMDATNKVTKEVDFDYVESFYKSIFINKNMNVICPRGSHHPFNYDEGKYIDLISGSENIFDGGDNWDLSCYLHQNSEYFLAFYANNGKYNNAYLTYMYNIYGWYGGVRIIKNELRELYDYRLSYQGSNSEYDMLALINDAGWLKVSYIKYTLSKQEQYSSMASAKDIVKSKNHTQAYFLINGDFKFYFMTYNNISDFVFGYPKTAPQNYQDVSSYGFQMNNDTDLEFIEDVEIEEMNFLLNNRFVYYKMKDNNSDKIYYGIIDIELNKVIFNTAEKITKFVPLNITSMLALTDDKAYEICLYKDNNGYCIDTCSNGYVLDTSGNKCGTECSTGKYLLLPNNICINPDTCDEKIFYKDNNNKKCGLCKDFDNTKIYKFEDGNKCLSKSEIPNGAYESNTKLHILKCSNGFSYKDNSCVQNCFDLCKDCDGPSTDINNQKCKSCINDLFVLESGNCYCKSGYEYKESEKNCWECKDEVNCKVYLKNTCGCTSCEDTTYLINERCQKCSSNCQNCVNNADKCTSCADNKFLEDSKCYDCSSNDICEQKISESSCKCKVCKDGYYLDFYTCHNCKEGCTKCKSENECTDCKQGYYLDNGQCLKCSDNCKTREDNSCKCTSCYENNFLNEDGQCIECSANYETCDAFEESCKCKDCKPGYSNEKFICKKCETEACNIFEKNSCNCQQCEEGYYKNKTFVCEECSKNCSTCDGPISGEDHHCTNCSESMYLVNINSNHICIDNCSNINYILNEKTNICEKPNNDNKGGKKNNNNVDYMLWIFVGIIGILLIVISICICKKCCSSNKSDADLINDTNELDEKELIN